jgi:hypothetical protein
MPVIVCKGANLLVQSSELRRCVVDKVKGKIIPVFNYSN